MYTATLATHGWTASQRLLLDAVIFLTPCLLFLEIRLVGRLFFSELILLGLLPLLLLSKGRLLLSRFPMTVLCLGLIWLFGQVATDLIRNTPFADYSRGWAKIIFVLINFMTLYVLLYRNRRRLVLFGVGIVVGRALTYLFNPSELTLSDPWKFGLGGAVALLFVLIAQSRTVYRVWFLPSIVVIIPATISLYQGFRSLAGVCFLTAVYLFMQQLFGRRTAHGARASPAKVALIFLVGIGASLAFMQIYAYAASEGLLGREAAYKYQRQAAGRFGLFLGGRAEIYVSSQAIMDSPVIGHGSWAKDPYYVSMLLGLERFGYQVSERVVEKGLIPTHSFLFGGWVEAGVLAAVFWLWVLWIDGRVLSRLFLIREPLTPLIAFVGILLLWDVLFSPFGAERRILVPYYLVLLMFARHMILAHARPAWQLVRR